MPDILQPRFPINHSNLIRIMLGIIVVLSLLAGYYKIQFENERNKYQQASQDLQIIQGKNE